MRYEHHPHYPLHHPLPVHDPAAVDFRAFYPYTPNEVKHRRRTTSSQLKVLESVFRLDTKPNATLRNELAAQLDMTARGVQVWFQNRRAKEKNKANRVGKSGTAPPSAGSSTDTTPGPDTSSPKEEDDLDTTSLPPPTPGEDPLEDLPAEDEPLDLLPDQPADSLAHSPLPLPASPPKLHVFTDSVVPRPSSVCSWQRSTSVDTPPESAIFPSRLSLADIHSQRRGSLPANAFFHPYSTHGPRSIDAWDPLARRRSVDTSLQRLVMNPYAQLARARNGALFGPRSPSQPQSGRQLQRSSHSLRRYNLSNQQPPDHYLDVRRASMDSRTLVSTRADRSSLSLSPRPLHPIRASCPDTSLYGATRRYVPQIPGPLPAPNFTFGAASMNSPCLTDEPQSPDFSSYTFPPKARDDTAEDDGMSSVSYETLSRFGSVVSVATSESSVLSGTGYYDIGPPPDDPVPNLEKRGSCGSVHDQFTGSVTAELDAAAQLVSSPAPLTGDGYFDENPTCSVLTSEPDPTHSQTDDVLSTSSFSSPASTASPDDNHMAQSSAASVNLLVSNASELALALNTIPGKHVILGEASTSTSGLGCAEQLITSTLGLIPSHIQSSSPAQQPITSAQQRHVVKNTSHDTSSMVDNSKNPTVITAATPGRTRAIPPVELVQDITGVHLTDEKLPSISKHKANKDDNPLIIEDLVNAISTTGDYAAQYAELVDGYGFGVPLAVPGDEVVQEQRQGTVAGCDAIVTLGADVGVEEFVASVVASSTYGAGLSVPDIGMGQPAFGVTFGP